MKILRVDSQEFVDKDKEVVRKIKKINPFDGMSREELWTVLSQGNLEPKECRLLHKALKRYGDGVFFRDRYPYLALQIMVVALAFNVVSILLRLILH